MTFAEDLAQVGAKPGDPFFNTMWWEAFSFMWLHIGFAVVLKSYTTDTTHEQATEEAT